jgi:hypothetical protein
MVSAQRGRSPNRSERRGRLVDRIGPLARLDADLAAQADDAHVAGGRVRDLERQDEQGGGRERLRARGAHAKGQLGHDPAPREHRRPRSSKNPSIARRASSPPSNPFQWRRTSPTSV